MKIRKDLGANRSEMAIHILRHSQPLMIERTPVFRYGISIIFMLLFTAGPSVYAQDRLIQKNADTILVKILDIGTDEISYKRFDNLDGPVFRVRNSKVSGIVFENKTIWSPSDDANKNVPMVIQEFSELRKQNKSLQLINDSTEHHIIMVHFGIPELDIYDITDYRFHGGVSYEWQPKGNRFGLRVMPLYTIEVGMRREIPDHLGSIALSLSPRYYAKNWKSSQFYIGIEAQVATHIPDKKSNNRINVMYNTDYDLSWHSLQTAWHFVFGGQVVSKNRFNMNAEAGIGYKLLTYEYHVDIPVNYYHSQMKSEHLSFFNVFARFGIGGRLRSSKK